MDDKQININNSLPESVILESIPVGIVVFDKNNNIISATDNLFRFGVTGFLSQEELVGQNLAEIEIFRENYH